MADDPVKPDGEQESPQTPPTGDGDGNRTFTQEDLDKIAEAQRKRGVAKGQADLLAALGVESVDDVKAALEEAAKLRDAQLSEKERLEKQLAEAKTAVEKAAAEAEAAKQAATEQLIQAAVIREASKADYKLYNEAIPDVWVYIDKSAIKVNEDGTFEGVDKAVEAVIKKRPYLVNSNGKITPGTPQRRKQVKQPDNDQPKSRTVRF